MGRGTLSGVRYPRGRGERAERRDTPGGEIPQRSRYPRGRGTPEVEGK